MRILQMFARRIAATLTFVLPKSAATAQPAPEFVVRKPAVQTFEKTDPDDAEYRAVARHIADLMLADEWVEIGDQIAAWERDLASTPGGLRFHEIAAEVALSGLQSVVDAAPRNTLADLDDAEYELSCFMDSYRGAPNHPILAMFAARAHLIMGSACSADHWPSDVASEAWRRMARHFVEAGDILEAFDPRALMSPLMAEAQYLQIQGSPGGDVKVPEYFEAWITLDPSNPRIYWQHAKWLSDPTHASQEALQSLADEALERTEDTLGMGGYALFFQPLLALSDDARSIYDPELFATGILDLATLSASQADVNRAADALADEIEHYGEDDAPAALKDTLMMLVRNEIEVFYPSLWTRPEDAIRSLVEEAANTIPDIVFDDKAAA